mgnify:CR=1 FL=1
MLGKNPFYHQTMRNCIIGFGKMFSDVEFERLDNSGTVQQKILVPIAYGPKEKWVQRLEQDPTLENQTYTTLPRMSFEMTNLNYDPSRKASITGVLMSALPRRKLGRMIRIFSMPTTLSMVSGTGALRRYRIPPSKYRFALFSKNRAIIFK